MLIFGMEIFQLLIIFGAEFRYKILFWVDPLDKKNNYLLWAKAMRETIVTERTT